MYKLIFAPIYSNAKKGTRHYPSVAYTLRYG